MKKFYLYFALFVALLCTTKANAGTKILYSANYESATSASDWTSPNLSAGLSLLSDDYGKFIQFSTGTSNDRSAHTLWGSAIFDNAGFTATEAKYHVEASLCLKALGTGHRTTEIAIMSDQTTCTKTPNNNFRAKSKNWIFDMTELTTGTATSPVFCFNGDSTNTTTVTPGSWYYIYLDVDTLTRKVDWKLLDQFKNTASPVASGTYTLQTDANVLAQGLYYLAGRYQNIGQFDNIQISATSSTDVANVPVIAMTGVDGASRTYNISFVEGEILHVSYNGATKDVQYADCDGVYSYTTTGSGTLEAYTTSGTATSEKASVSVDGTNISLPAATADIVAVKAGYGKSYKLSVDNSTVPTQPQIYIDYTFTPSDGSTPISATDQASGTTVELPSKGALQVTTKAKGFTSTITTINNDKEFKLAKTLNFAHYTTTDITNAGYAADGNVTGNYSTYGRLFWRKQGESKEDTIVYTTIPQYTKLSSAYTDSVVIGDMYISKSVTNYGTLPVNGHIYQGVGFCFEMKKGDTMSGNAIGYLSFGIANLTDEDFIIAYTMTNYGKDSAHPLVTSEEEYLASDNSVDAQVVKGTGTFSVNRISDCLGRVEVYSPAGATGIVNVNASATTSDPNAPIYTISGIRVSKNNLQKGLYIQNSKKFVVK